jgi:enoyl-CoA hydratase/carnithine racemase
MEPAPLVVDRRGAVAWVALDRPPLNLVTPATIDALRATFQALADDASVRAAVIAGSERAFCAGMDLRVLRDLDPVSARDLIVALHGAIEAVYEAPFPVLAMIHGACLGAGLELALACDLRVASEDARLGLPEVRVGIPSAIEAALLPILIGPARAAELLLTGESIDAGRALEWGLVNRVVSRDRLVDQARELADAILAGAPRAVRSQKALIRGWRRTDLASAIELGVAAFAAAYESDEPRRAMAAFLERRG